jgi:hypothetical protein
VPVQCQKSASSMMMGIGTPKSQSRMPLPMIFLLGRKGDRPDAIGAASHRSGKAPNKAQQAAKNEDATRFFCDGALRIQIQSSQM